MRCAKVLAFLLALAVSASSALMADPMFSIGNTNATYTYDTNSIYIYGYPYSVEDPMWWTNSNTGSTNYFSNADFFYGTVNVPLGVGTNIITVYGTNNVGVSTNESVTIIRGRAGDEPPAMVVTSTNSTFPYGTTSASVTGTNNSHVIGSMWWANSLNSSNGTFSASTNWTASSIPLEVGTNLITVYGTNLLSAAVTGSITFIRGGVNTGTPVVNVGNTNATFTHDTASVTVTGSCNTSVSGLLSWTNTFNGSNGTLAAATSWSITSVPLAVGTNNIAVYGSNILDNVTSGTVTFIRQMVGTGVPVVNITDSNTLVGYDVTSTTVNGTNNAQVVGSMWWTNSFTGSNGTLSASPSWVISNMTLDVGVNIITVYGSNLTGTISSDAITNTRSATSTFEELVTVDFVGKPILLTLYNNSLKTRVIQLQNNSSNVNATGFQPYFYIASSATNRAPISGLVAWRLATSSVFTVTYSSNLLAGISGEWIYGCGISNATGITTFNQGLVRIIPDPWR